MKKPYFYFLFFSTLYGFSFVSYAQNKAKTNPPESLKIADSLFMKSEWVSAGKMYETLLMKEENQKNPLSWNRLGYCYHQNNEPDKALKNYLRSLELKPAANLANVVHARIARIYAVRKDLNKAFDHLNQASLQGYANLKELDTEKEFESLREDIRFKSIYDKVFLNAFPCMADPKARQFDFWVGDWKVYQTGTKNLAGHSKIERVSGGCLILENWSSANGSNSGKSMNYYDPEKGKWEQVWVGAEGGPKVVHRFLNGVYKDEAMRFDFQTRDNQGKDLIGRFTFFNQGPDQVRQLNETSADNGATWQTTYDFTYIREK